MMGWISTVFGIGKGLYQAYKLWFLIVPIALLLVGIWLYVHNAERNEERLAIMTHEYQLAAAKVIASEGAVLACKAINKANEAEAQRLTEKVRQAEIRLAAANAAADKDVENINREETTFRATQLSCPAITPAFQRWLRGDS